MGIEKRAKSCVFRAPPLGVPQVPEWVHGPFVCVQVQWVWIINTKFRTELKAGLWTEKVKTRNFSLRIEDRSEKSQGKKATKRQR